MEKKFRSTISTERDSNYVVIFEEGNLKCISVKAPRLYQEYHFNPEEEGQQKITDEFLKKALSEIISSNISAFEMIYTSFENQEYKDMAQKVFKEYWNNLYNTIVADDIFGREISIGSLCVVHDFFEEHK